jgi:type IV pilus assembly protein PilP
MRRPTQALIGVVLGVALAAPVGAEEAAPPEARGVPGASDGRPYDPTGRRDPFRPPRASIASRTGEALTPLQRYEIGQLRLVAIIYNTYEPRAVVEDDEGLGYIVKVGTAIGPNGGHVQGIERGRVLIKEESVDYYGEVHPASVVMELRTNEGTSDRGKR